MFSTTPIGVNIKKGRDDPGFGNPGLGAVIPLGLTLTSAHHVRQEAVRCLASDANFCDTHSRSRLCLSIWTWGSNQTYGRDWTLSTARKTSLF